MLFTFTRCYLHHVIWLFSFPSGRVIVLHRHGCCLTPLWWKNETKEDCCHPRDRFSWVYGICFPEELEAKYQALWWTRAGSCFMGGETVPWVCLMDVWVFRKKPHKSVHMCYTMHDDTDHPVGRHAAWGQWRSKTDSTSAGGFTQRWFVVMVKCHQGERPPYNWMTTTPNISFFIIASLDFMFKVKFRSKSMIGKSHQICKSNERFFCEQQPVTHLENTVLSAAVSTKNTFVGSFWFRLHTASVACTLGSRLLSTRPCEIVAEIWSMMIISLPFPGDKGVNGRLCHFQRGCSQRGLCVLSNHQVLFFFPSRRLVWGPSSFMCFAFCCFTGWAEISDCTPDS